MLMRLSTATGLFTCCVGASIAFSSTRSTFSMGKAKKNRKKVSTKPFVVGPDYIQALEGKLMDKDVVLVLCGESHEDAIDVTRQNGKFNPKEGWVELLRGPKEDFAFDDIAYRITATTKKSLEVEKCKDWAKRYTEDEEVWGHIVLFWVEESVTKTSKGKGFLMELASEDDLDEDDRDEGWIFSSRIAKDGDCNQKLPSVVRELLQQDGKTTEPTNDHCRLFEWGDLDTEAYTLNKRRLTEEDIPTSDLDSIIIKRKGDRRQENIWTWDDWMAHVRANNGNDKDIDVQLVLEASVPPWELELCRPRADEDVEKIQPPAAAECIRCMSEDEEEDGEDECDPSSDGVGSYVDFVYRRFMGTYMADSTNMTNPISTWLHCVDTRDLGCHAACHADSVKEKWNDLLLPDEIKELVGDGQKQSKFHGFETDASNEFIKFVPQCRMNPERLELERMKSKGLLITDSEDEEDDEDSDSEDDEEFTFPSFEGFFGQSTDFLYYSPHVKLVYSPFLAKCVRSLPNWEKLFTNLFLGGTILDALSVLELDHHEDHMYVRSDLLKTRNPSTGSYEYRHRDDDEHYITSPFFPSVFHLAAKGSYPSRTWSSQLFAKLCTPSLQEKDASQTTMDIALAAREWSLESIRQHSQDPKGADDLHCGGEWFEGFLRGAHRDIYDDIDLSDSSVLLRKKYMKSESDGKKHNIGEITIPTMEDAFVEILDRFGTGLALHSETLVTPRVEVLAKILIDIWMSNLVDFSTVLKVAEIVSESKKNKVVVTIYMGSAHTRAVSDFYVNKMGFKKKSFVGKVNWDGTEPHTLNLPDNLWNLSQLFR